MKPKWGLYPWYVETGVDLIHPDDLDAYIKQGASSRKVFECITKGDDYITIKYNNNCYRVKDKLFKPLPIPKYNFGECVEIKKNADEAVITDIMWHYDKREFYYFISVRGKKKSKRYFEEEFM